MLFTDPLFLFYFLPVVLVLLRLASIGGRLRTATKSLIIVSTLVFYAYENWLWTLIFAVIVGGAYGCGGLIARTVNRGGRRLWLAVAIGHCLFFLGAFKYLDWAVGFLPVLGGVHDGMVPWFGTNGHIVLPPGISFYVFEAISYCFDVYRRKIEPPRNPLDFLCFIAMFPRFIAGPIVRYADMEDQLRNWPGMRLARGLTLFAIGFCIKCLLADQFSVFVPYGFAVSQPDFLQAWLGVLAYTFQLYFDFWSYSIMATGLGLCLGFEFPDNFRSPYQALSLTQFWRQWHITLSSWLRDYLYIGLGGNRHGPVRTYGNLLLTMMLGGLWHGANITFLLWGLYHGTVLAIERWIGEDRLARLPRPVRHGATFGFVVLGWVLFRSASLRQAQAVLAGMAGTNGFARSFNPLLLEKQSFAAGLTLVGLAFFFRGERWLVTERPLASRDFPLAIQLLILMVFVAALLVALSSAAIPFLYFQF
jgi:alginate O-acetyltransferase complex protein AlgI